MATVLSAIATVVVPRGVPVRLSRTVFLLVRRVFHLRRTTDYEVRDRVFAFYAPVALMALPGVWLALVVTGFTLVQKGLGVDDWRIAFELSGSSVTTLGFIAADTLPQHIAAFVEAGLGLLLVALLVTYLPSMYAGFQRREALVGRVAIQAGTPPDPVQLLVRFHRIRGMDRLENEVWEPWITGFIDLEETHTSLAALAFFRSTHSERSWLTASGCVLDAAALYASTIDGPRVPGAELCVRAGYLALRHIGRFYRIEMDPDPAPTDPISVTREEYDAAYDELAARGVPVKRDRDQAWRDFAGWRVNYDVPLLALAGLVMAPDAPWSSDRALPYRRPPFVIRAGHRS